MALNSVHDEARVVHSIGIVVGAKRFSFVLRYGFVDPREDRFDSEWSETLAETIRDEPFLDTMARAVARFAELTTPRETDQPRVAA